MSDIVPHLVRRAVGATQQYVETVPHSSDGQDEPPVKKLAVWALAMFYITAIFYFVAVSAISYTYGDVVATLTIIETPTATAFKTTSDEDSTDVKAPLLSEDQKTENVNVKALETDLFLVKQPPITAKLRTTVHHLRSVGGRLARFRGLHIALIYNIIHGSVVSLFGPYDHASLIRPLVSVIATVGLCRIQMAWTHVVISKPSQKSWWRRYPTAKMARHIVIPTAIFAVAQQVAMYVPAGLARSVYDQLQFPERYGPNVETVRKIALVELLLVLVIAISSIFLIVIPAEVTLKRVQASMLPEEDEAIVPFDRTFAGKVKPEILGGSGAIGMLDAWKTFDKEGRIRLIKLYFKVFAMQAALAIFFFMTVVAELRLVLGDDFQKVLNKARSALKQ